MKNGASRTGANFASKTKGIECFQRSVTRSLVSRSSETCRRRRQSDWEVGRAEAEIVTQQVCPSIEIRYANIYTGELIQNVRFISRELIIFENISYR
jgi:hypothetical protein